MNTAVRCLACGRNNVASPGSSLDTRQQLCMLNAEFLVQHDRRAKAVLAEEVARQNAAARQQHIDQVLAPRRAAQQAEDNHLFQQVVPLQAVVKEFRFKSYLRAKVLIALKTVTISLTYEVWVDP